MFFHISCKVLKIKKSLVTDRSSLHIEKQLMIFSFWVQGENKDLWTLDDLLTSATLNP